MQETDTKPRVIEVVSTEMISRARIIAVCSYHQDLEEWAEFQEGQIFKEEVKARMVLSGQCIPPIQIVWLWKLWVIVVLLHRVTEVDSCQTPLSATQVQSWDRKKEDKV